MVELDDLVPIIAELMQVKLEIGDFGDVERHWRTSTTCLGPALPRAQTPIYEFEWPQKRLVPLKPDAQHSHLYLDDSFHLVSKRDLQPLNIYISLSLTHPLNLYIYISLSLTHPLSKIVLQPWCHATPCWKLSIFWNDLQTDTTCSLLNI